MSAAKKRKDVGDKTSSKRLKKEMKCEDCDEPGHADIYSTECPMHVPLHERAQSTVVKASLKGRLRDIRALPVIETACDRYSALARRVHQLTLFHAMRMLESGRRPPKIDKVYLRQVINLIKLKHTVSSRTNLPDQELVESAAWFLDDVVRQEVDTTGMSGLIDDNISEIVTSYANFDNIALNAHIAMYIRAKYDIKRGHGSAIASKVCEGGHFQTLPKTLGGDVERWNRVVDELRAEYLAAKSEGSVGIQVYRHRMIHTIEQRNRELAAMVPPAEYRYRSFCLLPMRSNGRKFVLLSDRGVQKLSALAGQMATTLNSSERTALFSDLDSLFIREGKVAGHGPEGKLRTYRNKKNKRYTQPQVISRQSDISKNPNRWRLARSVRTNGVELHVGFETLNTIRPHGRIQNQRGHGTEPWRFDPIYDFSTLPSGIDIKDIIVHDPGNAAPFTSAQAVGMGADGKPVFEHRVFSKGFYGGMCKRNKVNAKELRDRKRRGMLEAIEQLSRYTVKTTNMSDLTLTLMANLNVDQIFHRFYSRKQWLKLKFEAKIGKDKAINKALEFLRGPRKAKLVVIGDGGRMSGIKGTTSTAPIARIKRLAVKKSRTEGWHIRQVNEAYTSKRSSCCLHHDTECILTGHKMRTTPSGRVVRTRVHGISRCTNDHCLTLWNRDKNATRNIWRITLACYRGEERPGDLTRENNRTGHASGTLPVPLVD